MTKFLKTEANRLVGLLPETDPRTGDYHMLLRSLEFLDGLSQTIDAIVELALEDEGDGDSSAIELQPIPFPGSVSLDPTNPVPVPAPVEPPQEPAGSSSSSFPVNNSSSVSADSPKEEKTWAASDVRAKLVEAKAKGVVVKALLKSFGVENFQELDQTKYSALMAALEQQEVV